MISRLIVPLLLIFIVAVGSLSLLKAMQNRNQKMNKKDIFILIGAVILSIIELKNVRNYFHKKKSE